MEGSLKKTILIVDGDRFFCEFLATKIKEAGYHAVQAFAVGEGAQIVRTFPVDVVIADSGLAHGGGAELIRQIRQFNPKYPQVILLDREDGETDTDGAFVVLPKSVDSYELLARVDDAVVAQMGERREFSSRNDRVPTILKAEIFIPGQSGPQSLEVANLSLGGMSVVVSDASCAIGTVVTFRLKTRERRLGPIEGFAVVRWVGNRRADGGPDGGAIAGVQFINLDESTSSRLQALLALLADSEITRTKAS